MTTIRTCALLAALGGGLMSFSGTAAAVPAGPGQAGALGALAADPLAMQVHGCHRDWRRGPYNYRGRSGHGWHRHEGRRCRVQVGRQYDRRTRPYDWNRRGCFQIGPVTVCP